MSKLIQALQTRAELHPDKIALRTQQEQLSYAQLLQKAQQLAAVMRELHINSVALLADNSMQWVVVDLAALIAQIPFIPLPTFFSNQQLAHIIGDSNVDVILTDDVSRLGKIVAGISDYSDKAKIKTQVKTQLMPSSLTLSLMRVNENNIVKYYPNTQKITFTSGSTGSPKGVCLTADIQFKVAQSLCKATEKVRADRHLCLMPLSTLLENIAGVYVPLLRGGEVYLVSAEQIGFSGGRLNDFQCLLNMISQVSPNSLILLPQLLRGLLDAVKMGWSVPSALKFITVGGSKTPVDWLNEAEKAGLQVFEGYGLSECSSVVALNTADNRQTGSQGRLLEHLLESGATQIVDGELMIRNHGFLGYLNHTEASPEWVATGDIAEIDDDGFVHIKGRTKNLIISSLGRNISPEWPEAVLLGDDLFKQAILVGERRPYCAMLFTSSAEDCSEKIVNVAVEQANQQLPEYAQIKAWHHVEKGFPVELFTENGRPKRPLIMGYYSEQIESMYAPNAY